MWLKIVNYDVGYSNNQHGFIILIQHLCITRTKKSIRYYKENDREKRERRRERERERERKVEGEI